MCVYINIREIQSFKKMLASTILYVLYKKHFPIFYFVTLIAIHQIDFMSTDGSQSSV